MEMWIYVGISEVAVVHVARKQPVMTDRLYGYIPMRRRQPATH